MMERNNYRLYLHRIFAIQLNALIARVKKLRSQDPDGYVHHPQAKLLRSVELAFTEWVPANPADKQFALGNTLGPRNRVWRRVKRGMPSRYRLFFRYATQSLKVIVYVWFNDCSTLRKAGDKNDVYRVFARIVERGEVPSSIELLMSESSAV